MASQTINLPLLAVVDPSAFPVGVIGTYGAIGGVYSPGAVTDPLAAATQLDFRGWALDGNVVCAGADLTSLRVTTTVTNTGSTADDICGNLVNSVTNLELPVLSRIPTNLPLDPGNFGPGNENTNCVGLESTNSPPNAALSFPSPVQYDVTYDLSGLTDADIQNLALAMLVADETAQTTIVAVPTIEITFDNANCPPPSTSCNPINLVQNCLTPIAVPAKLSGQDVLVHILYDAKGTPIANGSIDCNGNVVGTKVTSPDGTVITNPNFSNITFGAAATSNSVTSSGLFRFTGNTPVGIGQSGPGWVTNLKDNGTGSVWMTIDGSDPSVAANSRINSSAGAGNVNRIWVADLADVRVVGSSGASQGVVSWEQ